MWIIVGVAILGGALAALSPCVLPVLPVILAEGSAGGGRRRPLAMIGGLVVTFALATLFGDEVLSLLHLPQDFLNIAGAVAIGVVGVGLAVPAIGHLVERPFARLGGRRLADGGGFVLGMSLGLVFAPCAGPILAAVDVAGARNRIGWSAVAVALAYSLGAGVPLLALALLARYSVVRWADLRRHMPVVRTVSGTVMAAMAVVIGTGFAAPLQTSLSSYATNIEDRLESGASIQRQLNSIDHEHPSSLRTARSSAAAALPVYERAPNFTGITAWLNTPGDKPLSLARLRGKVVLVDFWTYSCINCRRSLPHVEAWYKAYHRDGLVVVGVHTPEFAFEHVVSNVRAEAAQLGVHYPVAVDDNYGTWDAYQNNYWPAEYLIDQSGRLRYYSFGEGDYQKTEANIRLLLEAGGATHLPPPTDVANTEPTSPDLTPESYVGYGRLNLSNYEGSPLSDDHMIDYQAAGALPSDDLTLGGQWDVHSEEATAGTGATIGLNFTADDVYLVLGGTGTVTVSVGRGRPRRIQVSGVPDLYTMVASGSVHSGLLHITLSPGLEAYDFTFG